MVVLEEGYRLPMRLRVVEAEVEGLRPCRVTVEAEVDQALRCAQKRSGIEEVIERARNKSIYTISVAARQLEG